MIFKRKKENERTSKEILSSFLKLEKKVKELESLVEELKKENENSIQKVEMIRFNPFSKTGGNQSFSLALLNKKNNGAVITNFYSNEGSSVYGKPIENGKSTYILSEEEKEAIEKATGENIFTKNKESKKEKKKESTKKTTKVKEKK